MKRSEIRILILDDEAALGRSYTEALQKAGFQVKAVHSVDEARQQLKMAAYDCIVTDVLLPKINGVEFIKELKKQNQCPKKVILTSGIFKDKSFMRDSIKIAGAAAYLQKPFDLQELIQAVHDAFLNEIDPDRDPLESLKENAHVSNQEILQTIQQLTQIDGCQLPYAYSLIKHAGLAGELTLGINGQTNATIRFSQGHVIDVRSNDAQSYFGALVIEKGYSTAEEIDELMAEPGSKPVGQRLVEAYALSPHAVQIILKEQMALRLSKTVQPFPYDFRFENKAEEIKDVALDDSIWWELLFDWIYAKCPMSWLKNLYNTWLDYPLELKLTHDNKNLFLKVPLIYQMRQVFESFTQDKTLQQILDDSAPVDPDDTLRLVHFLLISRHALFMPKLVTQPDQITLLRRLNQVAQSQDSQNYFEILGVHSKASVKEISRSYLELAKAFHPDKMSAEVPEQAKDLAQKVFSRITQAYETLSNDNKRDTYRKSIEKGAAEEVLHSESLFEEGRQYLNQGQLKLAHERFQAVAKIKNHRSDLGIYLSWTKLMLGAPANKQKKLYAEVGQLINSIPPEDRHSAEFLFVKGLYYRHVGDIDKALINFKNALTMDPSLRIAKREALKIRKGKSTNNDEGGLTAIFTNLLGGKKKRS